MNSNTWIGIRILRWPWHANCSVNGRLNRQGGVGAWLILALTIRMSYRPPRRRHRLTHSGDLSGTIIPPWSPESGMNPMDFQKIASGNLSLTAPRDGHCIKRERRATPRRSNEYAVDLVAKQPDRFGN